MYSLFRYLINLFRCLVKCRMREKNIFLLITLTFAILCVGGYLFLPELKAGTQFAYKQIRDAGPDLLGIIPPVEENDHHQPHNHLHSHIHAPSSQSSNYHNAEIGNIPKPNQLLHQPYPVPLIARGKLSDMQKLAEKIKNDMQNYNLTQMGAVLPKPFPANNGGRGGESDSSPNDFGGIGDADERRRIIDSSISDELSLRRVNSHSGGASTFSNTDSVEEFRRDTVRNMTIHAWRNYVKYAWGHNELRPLTKTGHTASIFGKSKLGATIIDAMDTLYIMGLKEDYYKGREWIEKYLNFDDVQSDISVFETNIRFIGGLLSLYALTNDRLYVHKAEQIAQKLLPAFNTPTGIPHSLINPRTGISKNYFWASSASSILSEIGTLHLEFLYLSYLTNNPVYREKVLRIRNILHSTPKLNGLYANFINPKNGRWGQQHVSIGALGDSFYEYLLKAYIQSDGNDLNARIMYEEAIDAIKRKLVKKSKGGLTYVAEMKYDRQDDKMDHLACFSGGLFALGAATLNRSEDFHLGAEVTYTCRQSYDRTAVKLGPESFIFTDSIEAKALRHNEKYYIQRPETVESYFYLWRFTGEQKYREWAWDVVQAFEKYCKTSGGYTGLKNVYVENGPKDDVQQSFFLAETLKYLYLIFSDKNLLSFDKWVFNTEAHPLPIYGKNPAFPLGDFFTQKSRSRANNDENNFNQHFPNQFV